MALRMTLARLIVAAFVLLPALAAAQGTAGISGTVRDTTGALLPGVTVEASSPALIEKSRSAVTDNSGQYRILPLVPGIYTVTFSLEGFSRVIREGIELRAETIVPVNAELRVGALAESVTVTGASPVVDLQTVSSVTVMTREILDVAPISKNLQTVGILIPGTSLQGSAQAVTRVGLRICRAAGGLDLADHVERHRRLAATTDVMERDAHRDSIDPRR